MADVVAGDEEIATCLILAAEHDMRMWVFGIPTVNRDPFEFGSEIAFRPLHEIPSEPPQVAKLRRIFGGHDEAELVPVFASPFLELLHVSAIGQRAVSLRRLAVAGDPISGDIAQMG